MVDPHFLQDSFSHYPQLMMKMITWRWSSQTMPSDSSDSFSDWLFWINLKSWQHKFLFVFQKLLISWDFHGQWSLEFTENDSRTKIQWAADLWVEKPCWWGQNLDVDRLQQQKTILVALTSARNLRLLRSLRFEEEINIIWSDEAGL